MVRNWLAEEYNISHTPVKGALNKLAIEHLIKLVPHKVGYIKGTLSRDIMEIYDYYRGS